jgi:hypothetical protein
MMHGQTNIEFYTRFVDACSDSYASSTVFFNKTYHVNFTLEHGTKAQRGSRGIALLFL